MKTEVTSKRFALNVKDFLRGMLIAMGTSALVVVQSAVDAGSLATVNYKVVIWAGIGGGVTYLLKNYFQPAQVKQTIPNSEVDKINADTAAK